jgi:hypothetical protein
MEVKLLQNELPAVKRNAAVRCGVDLHGVTVVEHLCAASVTGKNDRRKLGVDKAGQVDG